MRVISRVARASGILGMCIVAASVRATHSGKFTSAAVVERCRAARRYHAKDNRCSNHSRRSKPQGADIRFRLRKVQTQSTTARRVRILSRDGGCRSPACAVLEESVRGTRRMRQQARRWWAHASVTARRTDLRRVGVFAVSPRPAPIRWNFGGRIAGVAGVDCFGEVAGWGEARRRTGFSTMVGSWVARGSLRVLGRAATYRSPRAWCVPVLAACESSNTVECVRAASVCVRAFVIGLGRENSSARRLDAGPDPLAAG
jgi:hypothetical protein